MKLIRLASLLFLSLSVLGCSISGDAISGKVVDQQTEKPIPDAVVVARWIGDLPGWVDSKTVCYHTLSTMSDPEGNFHFPKWKKGGTEWQRKIKRGHGYVIAYKVGYVFVETKSNNIVYLTAFAGTREERLRYLVSLFGATGCGAQDESEKNRIPLLKGLYEEAQSLARTKEDERLVESIRYDLEILEFGFEEAEKRHLQRS